jgi:hypothetical protein
MPQACVSISRLAAFPKKPDFSRGRRGIVVRNGAMSYRSRGKYPPAEPGALDQEPPEAVDGVADAAPESCTA